MCDFLVIGTGIFAIIGVVIFGIVAIKVSNGAIGHCLRIKKLQNDLLVGDEKISSLSNADVLSLKNPIYTHVGFGGVGPRYHPCFEIMKMVDKELEVRRST